MQSDKFDTVNAVVAHQRPQHPVEIWLGSMVQGATAWRSWALMGAHGRGSWSVTTPRRRPIQQQRYATRTVLAKGAERTLIARLLPIWASVLVGPVSGESEA